MNKTEKDLQSIKQNWDSWTANQRKGFLIFLGVILFFIYRGCDNDNKSTGKAGNYTAESTEKPKLQEAWIISQTYVKVVLKAPATAEFPYDNAGGSIEENRYNINAYVDAQNSFGALLRSNYYCKMDYKGGNWSDINNWDLIYLSLDGKDYYNKNNIK